MHLTLQFRIKIYTVFLTLDCLSLLIIGLALLIDPKLILSMIPGLIALVVFAAYFFTHVKLLKLMVRYKNKQYGLE